MKLGGAAMVKNFDLLNRAIRSLKRACDAVFVLVDRSSSDIDMILEECEAKSVPHEMFDFTGFQDANNQLSRILRQRFACEWIFHLDADEELCPTQDARIREIADLAADQGYDAIKFPRRNFTEFRKSSERLDLYPDYQVKLHRWDVTYHWRVHPEIDHEVWKISVRDDLEIYHYGFALKSESDWARVNRFYGELLWRDIQDGRVWTGDPAAVMPPRESLETGLA